MEKIKTKDLKLGDVISLDLKGYSTATVISIGGEDSWKWVEVIRPYIHIANFIYTGGVIPYIGFEQFKLTMNEQEVTLLSRDNNLR